MESSRQVECTVQNGLAFLNVSLNLHILPHPSRNSRLAQASFTEKEKGAKRIREAKTFHTSKAHSRRGIPLGILIERIRSSPFYQLQCHSRNPEYSYTFVLGRPFLPGPVLITAFTASNLEVWSHVHTWNKSRYAVGGRVPKHACALPVMQPTAWMASSWAPPRHHVGLGKREEPIQTWSHAARCALSDSSLTLSEDSHVFC